MTDWSPHLAPGERLLWQGRPDPAFRLSPRERRRAPVAAVLALGALAVSLRFWPADAKTGAVWLMLAAFLALLAVLPAWLRTRGLRRSAYAVTDRRALMLEGGRLRSWPIGPETRPRLNDQTPPSLWFADDRRERYGRVRTTPVVFSRIPDAARVQALMAELARRAAASDEART